MNCVPSIFASLCFVLAACSGASTGDGPGDGTTPTAGSFGTSGSTGSGGSVSVAGNSAAGGGSSTTGGTSSAGGGSFAGGPSTSGGSTAMGGTNAVGGASSTGGGSGVGGSSSMGGTSAMGGSAGSAGQGGGPALTIDYSIWQLQLPTGSGTSPTTVAPSKLAAYSDAYFYKGDDGGQVFMDPQTGITTSGSQHPRCELRESTTSGGQAAWSAAATNTMTVTGKVMKGSSVTIAQVFNGPDSITLAELQYNSGKGGLELFYEEAKGQGAENDLSTPIALNEKYTFTMSLTKNVLTVSVNGKQVYTHTPSASTLSSQFYFKVGDYDQTATKGAISTTPQSLVEDYSIVVVHK